MVAKTVFAAIKTKTTFVVRIRLGRSVVNSYGFANTILETSLTSQQHQVKLNQILTAFYQAGFVPDQVENNLVSLIRTD